MFALVIAASLTAHTTNDGRSNWFARVLLLALYLILAVGFFHAPACLYLDHGMDIDADNRS